MFALVGVGQHVTQEIFWNPALERSNEFHFYFRANSLFWDPNIYGRYLALAAILVLAVVMWTRDMRRLALLAGALAVLLAGLGTAFSQDGKHVFTVYEWESTQNSGEGCGPMPAVFWMTDRPYAFHIGGPRDATQDDVRVFEAWLRAHVSTMLR